MRPVQVVENDMSGILEILKSAQGGAALSNLGMRYDLTPRQTERAVTVLVPELAKGFERNMLDRKGMAQLLGALSSGHHIQYADDPAYHASSAAQTDGENILGHLLGSKTGSRQLAAYGQQETGIPAEVLKQMLPGLATLFMGAVSKQGAHALGAVPGGIGGLEEILKRLPQSSGPGGIDIGDILRRLPQGGGAPAGQGGGQGGGLGDILGEIFKRLPQGGSGGGQAGGQGGGYGIPPLPGGSGQPAPSGGGSGGFQIPGFPEVRGDSGTSGGGWGGDSSRGGSPLPLPGNPGPASGGGNNPWGDVGDIVRGGGTSGGLLATILRTLFGSIIGRSAAPAGKVGGGMMGWLIKMFLMRYGWRIVTGLFRGILRR